MIDGFLQQYRDGGWVARWSSPGYADLMVGTSSDVAFADAWLKGVGGFDAREHSRHLAIPAAHTAEGLVIERVQADRDAPQPRVG